MPDELVTRSDHEGLTTLTLNRPDKLNALTPRSFVELRAHLDAIATDGSVGCVVLRGAGRSFCAGHDLESIATGERAPSRHFEPETVDALEQLPQPTIARLHGHCFTGGLELALACDLLIAAESTKLGDTHGQWGLVQASGAGGSFDREGTDVHEPTHRRPNGGGDRSRRPVRAGRRTR
jgi:enoyl-CoA hydratase